MNEKRDDSSFDKRLADARSRQGINEPKPVVEGDAVPTGAAGIGARVGVELASALVVGLVIGYWLDRWLHTKPVFLLLFLVVGGAAGIMNVFRTVLPRGPSPKK